MFDFIEQNDKDKRSPPIDPKGFMHHRGQVRIQNGKARVLIGYDSIICFVTLMNMYKCIIKMVMVFHHFQTNPLYPFKAFLDCLRQCVQSSAYGICKKL